MYLNEAANPPTATRAPQPIPDPAPSAAARIAATGLARLWRAGIMREPSLHPDTLITQAVRAERHDDFGPGDWRAALSVLTGALDGEAALNPIGRTLAHGQIVKLLRERLRAHALWHRHPEIFERPITAPIIVLGSMRSGTTRIQRLLACDDRLRHTRLFESLSPVPPGGSDLRAVRAGAGLTLLHAFNPALKAIHPTAPRQPDEEFGLFGFGLGGAHFEAQWRIPGFARWSERRDALPVYRDFCRLLQTIAWSRGGVADRPWVLKAPQFMEDLDALLTVFPDARLLCLERDPVAVVASSASLVWQQQRVQSDHADRHWIGREWLRKTARRVDRATAVRRAHPHVPSLSIDFAAVTHDWRAEMARVYAFLGLPLEERVETRMARYLARAQAHQGHRYALTDFGLSEREVRLALPAYEPTVARLPTMTPTAAPARRIAAAMTKLNPGSVAIESA